VCVCVERERESGKGEGRKCAMVGYWSLLYLWYNVKPLCVGNNTHDEVEHAVVNVFNPSADVKVLIKIKRSMV
jgi:hypothetical protein